MGLRVAGSTEFDSLRPSNKFGVAQCFTCMAYETIELFHPNRPPDMFLGCKPLKSFIYSMIWIFPAVSSRLVYLVWFFNEVYDEIIDIYLY
jgi:hypothetical protein